MRGNALGPRVSLMNNTNNAAPVARTIVFTTARNADGLFTETRNALTHIPTDALVECAQLAYDAIKHDRFRPMAGRPTITRVSWLTGNGILDESLTRDRAVHALCAWAHDQRMIAFGEELRARKLAVQVNSAYEALA